ncbi:MAG: hypothetical protein DME50_16055 [Verrucomicrobia bacterium]|nr:MAG: hypothetical protein DME50_16055 [Verrucomicrobiota bacterium]
MENPGAIFFDPASEFACSRHSYSGTHLKNGAVPLSPSALLRTGFAKRLWLIFVGGSVQM